MAFLSDLSHFIALELHDPHLFPSPPLSGDWVTNHEPEAEGWRIKYASCFSLTEELTAKTPGLKYKHF
jgi:hypothetical protein